MLYSSDVQSYVGLSGTLHGLFAYYALREALQGRLSSWLLVFGVGAKVIWELVIGPSQSSMEIVGTSVAVEAHLYGMISGFILAIFYFLSHKNVR